MTAPWPGKSHPHTRQLEANPEQYKMPNPCPKVGPTLWWDSHSRAPLGIRQKPGPSQYTPLLSAFCHLPLLPSHPSCPPCNLHRSLSQVSSAQALLKSLSFHRSLSPSRIFQIGNQTLLGSGRTLTMFPPSRLSGQHCAFTICPTREFP